MVHYHRGMPKLKPPRGPRPGQGGEDGHLRLLPQPTPAERLWPKRCRYLAELLKIRQNALDAMLEAGVFSRNDSDEVIIRTVRRLSQS